jgi:LysM repeat protein
VGFLFVATLLAACERPLNREDDDSESQDPLPTVVIIESQTSAEETLDESDEPSAETEEPEAEIEEPEEEITEAEPEAEPTEDVPETEPTPEEEVEESDEAEEVAEEEEAEEEPTEDEVTEEADSEDTEETTEDETKTETEDADESDQEEVEETEAPDDSDLSAALPVTHTVAAGENLYRISLLYDIPLATLAAYNNIINVDQVYAGQVLLIPGGTEIEPPETEEPEEPEEPVEPDEPPAEGTLYTVQLGDTLGQIGLLFGVSWVEIAEANGIVNPNEIYAGQVLKIPTSAPGPNPQFAHTVSPGESLNTISLNYGVAWLTIATANQLGSPYVIYPGQTLVIPGA